MSNLSEWSLTALRIFFGLALAFGHGLGKLPPSEKFYAGVAEMGFPMPMVFAWAAALSEFVGGLLVASGLLTRFGGIAISITMAVAFFIRHAGDSFHTKELSLTFLLIALVFALRGGGKLSLDQLLRKGGLLTR